MQNKLSSARQAFDAFFKRYPYCYGYWKKYADMERKNDNIERAKEVCMKHWYFSQTPGEGGRGIVPKVLSG